MSSPSKKKNPQSKMTVFGTAPVSSKGQIVIPAKLRKAQNIKAGDTLIFTGSPDAGHFHVLSANSFKGFTEDLNNLIFNGNKKLSGEKPSTKQKSKS